MTDMPVLKGALKRYPTTKAILDGKGIPNWIDFWGGDVNHDWPWWRRMLPYFLDKLELPAYTEHN